MQPTQELVDEIYRERVLRARATPPERKLFAGPELFGYACRITLAGIRNQYPDADESEIQQMLSQRLSLGRRLRERI